MSTEMFEFEFQILGEQRVRLVIYDSVNTEVYASKEGNSQDDVLTADLRGLQARLQPCTCSPRVVDAVVSDYWGALRKAPVVDMRPGAPCLSCQATTWRWKRRSKCSECFYGSPLKFEPGDARG